MILDLIDKLIKEKIIFTDGEFKYKFIKDNDRRFLDPLRSSSEIENDYGSHANFELDKMDVVLTSNGDSYMTIKVKDPNIDIFDLRPVTILDKYLDGSL